MKTMLKVTLLFALVAFANTLFATGNLKVNMLPINDEKAVVAISRKLQIKVQAIVRFITSLSLKTERTNLLW